MNDRKQEDSMASNLAAFKSAKAEITSRAAQQSSYVTFTVTAIGVIASLAFSEHADAKLFFLIPIIASVLGLMWIDHAINIGNLGLFIRDEVYPQLRKAAAAAPDSIADYERYATQHGAKKHIRIVVFGLPIFMIFGGIPLIAWLLPFFLVQEYNLVFGLLAALGGALLAVFALYWFVVITFGVWAKPNVQ